jgi:hypothetical protein
MQSRKHSCSFRNCLVSLKMGKCNWLALPLPVRLLPRSRHFSACLHGVELPCVASSNAVQSLDSYQGAVFCPAPIQSIDKTTKRSSVSYNSVTTQCISVYLIQSFNLTRFWHLAQFTLVSVQWIRDRKLQVWRTGTTFHIRLVFVYVWYFVHDVMTW